MISIIDYGAGNLQSVQNALQFIGAPCRLIETPEQLLGSEKVLLPGVGSFGDAMQKLRRNGMDKAIRDYHQSGRPLFGICLGLQLLFDSSEEAPGVKGLGLLEGTISRIPSHGLKVPQIGWNSLTIQQKNGLFHGVADQSYVYFVHSYYLRASNRSDVAATTEYGVTIDAAVERGNLCATQFHPEKSGDTGLQMLRNFAGM